VAQERSTRNAAGLTKRRHRGAHRMVTGDRATAGIEDIGIFGFQDCVAEAASI
jgi:hypothetical protein